MSEEVILYMLKDRSKARKKKSEKMSIRLPSDTKASLEEVSGGKISTYVYEVLIAPHIRKMKMHRKTDYKCENCNSVIRTNEKYYCELANVEKFVLSDEKGAPEIEVKDSQPTRILCRKCAEKEGLFEEFEGEPSIKVKRSERTTE